MSALRRIFSTRTLAYVSAGSLLVIGGGYTYLNSGPAYPVSTKITRRPPPPWTPPTRSEMLKELKASGKITDVSKRTSSSQGEEFDLLIVGGGATGAGCAVDAASRGLKVALVERDDFGAGTSWSASQPSSITTIIHFSTTAFYRNVVKVHKTRPWRSEISPKGRFRTGLRPIQVGPRSLARAADIPANSPVPFFHAPHLQVLASPLLLGWVQTVRHSCWQREHGVFVYHEQGESFGDLSDVEQYWSQRRNSLL